MTVQQGVALGFLAVSLVLRVGWQWLKQEKYKPQFERFTAVPGVKGAAVFIYFVGLPYLAVILGILTPRLLGLTGLEHFTLINWDTPGLAFQVQQATTLMLVEWLLDSSATFLVGSVALAALAGIWMNLTHYGVIIPPIQQPVALSTLYFALHWAFYRAMIWSVTDNLYLGVVLGAGVVMVEWMLVYWPHRHDVAYHQRFIVNAIILWLTALIFYYSPNLWLLLPFHWLMVTIVNWSRKTLVAQESSNRIYKQPEHAG